MTQRSFVALLVWMQTSEKKKKKKQGHAKQLDVVVSLIADHKKTARELKRVRRELAVRPRAGSSVLTAKTANSQQHVALTHVFVFTLAV